ncbi:unnamed protein product [Parajaminaea phylloscopi]
MSRPEHQAPPEIFYGDDEAGKYTANTRIQNIQATMTHRAIELLNLPAWKEQSGALLLDIGCGSGLSGEILTEYGHEWVGFDISPSMLEVALDRDVEGDVILADGGQGVPCRAGTFDGAISISVLQWLCNADSTSHSPVARLLHFFTTLHASLSRGARAVFQFYPQDDDQVRMIMSAATRAGFGGGLVVDYPNSKKAKKFYLVIWSGGAMSRPKGMEAYGEEQTEQALPQGLRAEHEADLDEDGRPSSTSGPGGKVKFQGKRERNGALSSGSKKRRRQKQDGFGLEKGSKEWVLRKKDLYRKRGKEDVPTDSKYTGRKRRVQF